jgi:pyruvate dehydrogenase E2 component (dihydrolipoamide acetyltransferase)
VVAAPTELLRPAGEKAGRGATPVVTVETFDLPELGDGVVAGELVEWHAAPGDAVAAGEPIAAVETGKTVVDVPSPADGTVVERDVEEGAAVLVGGPFLSIDVTDD